MSTSTLSIGDAIKNRGSLHTLSDEVVIPDARVQEIVRHAILHSPTPFNCQSGRAVVLLKEEHRKFWDLAYEAAKGSVPPPLFEKVFGPRIKTFRPAYGTVSFVKALWGIGVDIRVCVQILFYESGDALKATAEKMPVVKDKIPQCEQRH